MLPAPGLAKPVPRTVQLVRVRATAVLLDGVAPTSVSTATTPDSVLLALSVTTGGLTAVTDVVDAGHAEHADSTRRRVAPGVRCVRVC